MSKPDAGRRRFSRRPVDSVVHHRHVMSIREQPAAEVGTDEPLAPPVTRTLISQAPSGAGGRDHQSPGPQAVRRDRTRFAFQCHIRRCSSMETRRHAAGRRKRCVHAHEHALATQRQAFMSHSQSFLHTSKVSDGRVDQASRQILAASRRPWRRGCGVRIDAAIATGRPSRVYNARAKPAPSRHTLSRIRFMPTKRILTTGGAGFIGCNAARFFGARN